MAAPKTSSPVEAEPVRTVTPSEDRTAEFTPDARVESVTQYLDEMSDAEAMAKMRAFVSQQKDLREMGRGQWYPPHTHPHIKPPEYRCVRLGALTDVKKKAHIEAQLYILIAQGWKKCPPGMRYGPCPLEGDHGVYVYIPEPAARVRDDYERECRKAIDARRLGKESEDLADLARTSGISIEDIRAKSGQTSVREFLRKR